MKTFLFLASLLSSTVFAADFKECKVVETTKLRIITDEVIEAGSIAVLRSGKNITLNDVLTDKMIHFKSTDGKISESYQWMYAKINKVENRPGKYLSTSYSEDIVVSIGDRFDQEGETTISYAGVGSGEYLRLLCK